MENDMFHRIAIEEGGSNIAKERDAISYLPSSGSFFLQEMNKKRTIYVLILTSQGMRKLFNFSQKFRLRKRVNRFK